MELTPGKIYLADQRGLFETSAFRRYSTFNFEKYYHEDKEAQGNLFICNDDALTGKKLTFFLSKEDSFQIFVPITGGIDIIAKGEEFSVDTGQILTLNLEKGEVLEISNPYEKDVINYIQIGIKNNVVLFEKLDHTFLFDFENNQNKLIEIISFNDMPFRISAGIFGGREEAIYKMQNPKNNFYAFIIDGAFEIEGRLMHARDGLALWDTEQIELEALSNNAIVLIVEMLN